MRCRTFLVSRMGIPCGSFKALSVFYVTSEEHNIVQWERRSRGRLIHHLMPLGGRVCSQVDWSTELWRNIRQCCNCWITFTSHAPNKHHHTRLVSDVSEETTHDWYENLKRVHNTQDPQIHSEVDIYQTQHWLKLMTLHYYYYYCCCCCLLRLGKTECGLWRRDASVLMQHPIIAYVVIFNKKKFVGCPIKDCTSANWAEGKIREYSKHKKNTELDWSKTLVVLRPG